MKRSGVARYSLAKNPKTSLELPAEISHCITRALEEDIGSGDVTTNTIVPADASLRGRIFAKQDGVVAGLEIAKQVMLALDQRLTFLAQVEEGRRLLAEQCWQTSKVRHARC